MASCGIGIQVQAIFADYKVTTSNFDSNKINNDITCPVGIKIVSGNNNNDNKIINNTILGCFTVEISANEGLPENTFISGNINYLVPQNIKTTATENSIIVNWDAIVGATGYEIEVDGNVIDNGMNTSYTQNNLASNSNHNYRVRIKNGQWSNSVNAIVPAGSNADQGPPIGLAAVAPITYGGSDGKITGTTTAMEYKLSTDSDYTAVAGTEITGLEARTYNIRYAAKSGFNAGTVIDVEVPSGSNANQGPPIGLAAVAPITYGGSDGKITGTTTAMEYKLSTDSDYTAVAGTENHWIRSRNL